MAKKKELFDQVNQLKLRIDELERREESYKHTFEKAAVGIAGVDRRVLSLKDPLEITPMDQFYNPELRTMSTTGSKIGIRPSAAREQGTIVDSTTRDPNTARRRRMRQPSSGKFAVHNIPRFGSVGEISCEFEEASGNTS